jgi:hypothetical protein
MKSFIFLGIIAFCLTSTAVEPGTSRDAVIAELGEPSGNMQSNGKEILLFKTGTVTLQNGLVIETDISQDYARQAEERARKAEEARLNKQIETEKQKLLYPEDRITPVECAYSKIENWNTLPESLRPSPGKSQYIVYIPQGYHELNSHYYPALFLESPVLWDRVKDRARKEKWIVIVLPNATGSQIGKTMNESFLAAYDDATTRFRIDNNSRFIAGRIPASVFATLRPVAGIILQEPDFTGLIKANFIPDFLCKNPNLRAYILLGKKDSANTATQIRFVTDKIPNHQIYVYNGYTETLPQALADLALNWMKTEYHIP